jgi:hypothetical protein
VIYLYVKTHNATGLKYFGKTTNKSPEKYKGSGLLWKRHIKKYGYDVSTEIVASFENELECQEFALAFSKQNNIVASEDWANLREENGTDGAPFGHEGHVFTEEELNKISISSKNKWKDPDFRSKMLEKQRESWTEERKFNLSKKLTGMKRPKHSDAMRGRKLQPQHPFLLGIKTKEHCENISKALKGKPKSESHKEKLRMPRKSPELVVCRLLDKRLMSRASFTRWLNNF